MSIVFPRTDILTAVRYSADTNPPQLIVRQETSRTAGGQTIGKDLGPALWSFDYTTQPIPNEDSIAFEAMLDSLDGVIQLFEAYDLRRLNPRAYPTGACNDGVLRSVNANNKALALSGLIAGQIVSAGDYLSFSYGVNRAYHRILETVIADELGITAQFEVRPHLRPGWTFSPVTPVTLKSPSAICILVPGSVSARPNGGLHTVVSFQAQQYIG